MKKLLIPLLSLLITSTYANDISKDDYIKVKNIINSRYASWGILPINKKSSINIEGAWKNFKKNKDIVVAVIDTGVDPNHPFLKENLVIKKNNNSLKAKMFNYGRDFSKNNRNKNTPNDTHGHGTHVSGIIKSVFPKVKILPLKYYEVTATGKENLRSTIDALEYAINQNVDIINYSGGGPEPDLEELNLLKKAEAKGILIVAAAGNEQSNIDNKVHAYYPASYKLSNIITVTAHDRNLQVLGSSNYGRRSVDLAAPGERIKSAIPGARASFLTGTSQATAFVTGAAALIMSKYPDLSAKEIKNILRFSAKKEFTLMGKCNSEGRLDVTKAMSLAEDAYSKK